MMVGCAGVLIGSRSWNSNVGNDCAGLNFWSPPFRPERDPRSADLGRERIQWQGATPRNGNTVCPDYAIEAFIPDRPLEDDESPNDVYEVPAGLE